MDAAPARSPLGMFAAATALLLPLAFSPALNSPFWSARLAIVVLVVAIGLPRLAALVRREDPTAALASAFLVVAALATLVAREPAMALVGPYGWGAGLVLVAGAVGAWALGRSLDERARSEVATAIVAAVLVNAGVALAQRVFGLGSLGLSTSVGAYGLMGNPVHLGALLAGGAALLVPRFGHSALRWAPGLVVIGAALQVSGSRFGLLAMLCVTAAALRRWRWPRAVAVVACLAVGFGGALALEPVLPDHAGSPTVVQKLEAASEGELYDRAENWRSGVRALADRPVLGYGPGRFVEATSPRRTARMAAGDPERVFLDGHNIFMEYLVTTGPLGLACLLGFLGLAIRRARGPLLWCALGILALHLMQPQSLGTTPVAFLALGAAGPLGRAGPRRWPVRAVSGALLLPAVLAGAAVLLGDFRLDQADLDFSADSGRAAAATLRPWPEPASKVGQILFFHASTEKTDMHRRKRLEEGSLRWLAEAVRRDPAIATSWNNLADVALVLGREEQAREAFAAALERNPWSGRALTGLAGIALRHSDEATARPLIERAERVMSPEHVAETVERRRR